MLWSVNNIYLIKSIFIPNYNNRMLILLIKLDLRGIHKIKIIIVTQISIIYLYLTRSLVIIRSMIIILKNMRTLSL
jgi:hypothetical protein